MARTLKIQHDTPITPGTVSVVGPGVLVVVDWSATQRHDWAAMWQAVSTAFVRGADVRLIGATHFTWEPSPGNVVVWEVADRG